MPTLKIKATEMTAAKVDRISLVQRAATRMPFKVLKEENPMSFLTRPLDLARVGSAFKRDASAAPTLLGVATMKSDSSAVKDAIAAAGFLVTKEEDMGDGTVAFAQVDNADFQDDVTVIRMNDNVALALKGFRPWNVDMSVEGGASFSDLCKAQGFYPGIRSMTDVLLSAVINAAENAASPAEGSKAVAALFDEAKSYVTGLVSALPGKAFKLEYAGGEDEVAAAPVLKAEGTDPEPKVEDATDPKPADPVVDAAPVVAADPAAGAPVAEPAPAVKAETAPVVAPAATHAALPDEVSQALKGMADIAATVGKMATQVGELATKFDSVDGSLKDLSERVVKAEKVAEGAQAALEGTVVLGGGGAGDRESVQKQDGTRPGREVDTGFAPRRRPGR